MKRRRPDAGFTLVELMVATVISTVIAGTLASSVIVGLRNAGAISLRLATSHDAQLAQSYFTSDVLSADQVDVNAGDNTCPGLAGEVLVARYRWAVRPAVPTDPIEYDVAVYRTRTAGSERQLIRQMCSSTTDYSSVVLVARNVLAHNLTPSNPTVGCTYANAPVSDGCTSVSSAHPFETSTLSLTSSQTVSASTDSLPFTLRATRRSTQ